MEDLKNTDLIKLSKNLKEESYKQTLTKIVNWQERNIPYWDDRAHMFKLLHILLILSVLVLPLQNNIKFPVIIVLALIGFFDLIYSLVYILIIVSFIILLLTLFFTVNFSATSSIISLWQFVLLTIVFGCIISLLFYLVIKYRSMKLNQPKFRLSDTFKLSLPIDKILKYRLAICRDYAKLTAALLYHIYPNKQVFFIEIREHVATAINVDGMYYVLDQRLPILTLDKWMAFWKLKLKRKVLEVDILEMKLTDKKVRAKKIESKKLKKIEIPTIDINDLQAKLQKHLKLPAAVIKHKPDLELPIQNFAVRYGKEAIVEHSILTLILNKLENEFCGDLTRLAKIDLAQKENDLIVRVFIK